MSQLPGKREQAVKAREMLMHGIANVLGYWRERDANPFGQIKITSGGVRGPRSLTDEEAEEFGLMLQREADRIAKLFGYDEAWSN